MAINTVKVIRDFDGYFEREAKRIATELPQLGYEITVYAGPYASADVSYSVNNEKKQINLEYYSAVRAGFGRLWHNDVVKEVTEMMKEKDEN